MENYLKKKKANYECFPSSIIIFLVTSPKSISIPETPNWLEPCLNSCNQLWMKAIFNETFQQVKQWPFVISRKPTCQKLFLRKKSESNQKMSRDCYHVFLLYWPKKTFWCLTAWLKSNVHSYLWEHHSACVLISFWSSKIITNQSLIYTSKTVKKKCLTNSITVNLTA